MFLHEFEHKAAKAIFLEYGCLLAMADKGFIPTAEEISDSLDSFVQPYADCITDYELKKLKEYAKELDFALCMKNEYFSSSDYTNHAYFLQNILEKDSEKYDFHDECVSHVYGGHYGFDGLEECLESGYFPALGRILKLAVQEVLKKYGDDKETKQRVIHELISSGVDLMDINPEKIHGVMISFEDIKSKILRDSVEILSSTKTAYLDEMTNKDKKSVLFELISFCFNSGKISNNQMDLIKQICICLRVDSAYIEEFMEVIQRLFAANKEAKELINE